MGAILFASLLIGSFIVMSVIGNISETDQRKKMDE